MKLVKAEKIEASKYELHISIDTATFEAAVTKAFQKEGKKMSIPGFRPIAKRVFPLPAVAALMNICGFIPYRFKSLCKYKI